MIIEFPEKITVKHNIENWYKVYLPKKYSHEFYDLLDKQPWISYLSLEEDTTVVNVQVNIYAYEVTNEMVIESLTKLCKIACNE